MPTEDQIEEKLFQAIVQIQKNKIYFGQNENTINDGLRDMLSMVFDCYDQTRQGVSENEIESGEVDILIKQSGIPVSIIESVRVKCIARDSTIKHINKVLTKYDDNGCRIVNLIIYAMMKDFSSYWEKLKKFIGEIEYPYEVIVPFEDIDTFLAESRHGKMLLSRQDISISFHIYAVHMRE